MDILKMCNGSSDNLDDYSSEVCIPSTKEIKKIRYIPCNFKCKFDSRKCNSSLEF